jgi:hypothetical protein
MKFLLLFSILFGSAVASANVNDGLEIKCFEKDHGEMDLAYIIKEKMPVNFDRDMDLMLLDCTRGEHPSKNCDYRGELKREFHHNERCLVLKRHDSLGGSWSLCMQRQENLNPSRLIPVRVTDDRQESRIYCETSLHRVL